MCINTSESITFWHLFDCQDACKQQTLTYFGKNVYTKYTFRELFSRQGDTKIHFLGDGGTRSCIRVHSMGVLATVCPLHFKLGIINSHYFAFYQAKTTQAISSELNLPLGKTLLKTSLSLDIAWHSLETTLRYLFRFSCVSPLPPPNPWAYSDMPPYGSIWKSSTVHAW